ncbi:hypothetical protein ScPMuIL_012672 [Solemya velum]
MDNLKKAACKAIDSASSELNEISQNIWKNPELNYGEKNAHDVLTSFLHKHGLTVDKSYKLDTAFRAVTGDEGPHVGILCEYDALPEIGHACGHNLIAEVGVAAGIGIKAAFDEAGTNIGKVTVLGTPAEEGGGGKIDLLKAGAFQGMDVAMMAHPKPYDYYTIPSIGCEGVTVTFHGKASHASAFPWDGVNALDAAVLCYQTVSCMRQQFKPTWRVHGIIKNGGAKPNIIPEISEMEFMVRAPTPTELETLKEKITWCFESAAKGTGCTVQYKFDGKPYLNVVANRTLADSYTENLALIGVDIKARGPNIKQIGSGGSTDMGNVSQIIPSIHPVFYIGTDVANHTKVFAEASGKPEAQPFTLNQAKALALTAIDVYTKPGMLDRIKADFQQDMAEM